MTKRFKFGQLLAQDLLKAAENSKALKDAETPKKLIHNRFNPHPKGQAWSGTATELVEKYLAKYPDSSFSRAQLISATGCTGPSVDWALIYLKTQDRIAVTADSKRNARYFRYRIKLKN